MAARNRARTPVRIRCIKKTTPPETSCGTPEEAYKVPPSLTVAIRDQQLGLVPSRRPRPEQHSPRIPLVPRALLRALETELLDQRAPFHVLGRDVAAHLLDRRRVVRDEADGRERRSPPSRSPAPRRQFESTIWASAHLVVIMPVALPLKAFTFAPATRKSENSRRKTLDRLASRHQHERARCRMVKLRPAREARHEGRIGPVGLFDLPPQGVKIARRMTCSEPASQAAVREQGRTHSAT